MKKPLLSLILIAAITACSDADIVNQVAHETENQDLGFTDLYLAFNCDQLYSEAQRISEQMQQLALDYAHDIQINQLEFVSGIVYWPVLLFVDASADTGAVQEYRQLKARLHHLSLRMTEHNCQA